MTAPKHSASSQRWLARQSRDPFVEKAKQSGYRSRSAYKLLEIQKRDKIFKPGMCVIDLGAAPGGWSQVTVECLKKTGRVIALDKLLMEPLEAVDILEVDFEDEQGFKCLVEHLGEQKVDVILSDMAPNLTGISTIDQSRSIELAELAFLSVKKLLAKGGSFVVKLFEGEESRLYWAMLKEAFGEMNIRKPEASRQQSREIYIVAKRYLALEELEGKLLVGRG